MTVRELIKILKTASPNDLVVMSSDPEGNYFECLSGIDVDGYNFTGREGRRGDIKLRKLTPEMEQNGYTQEDVGEGTPSVILWS